jgi:hypothetical protein
MEQVQSWDQTVNEAMSTNLKRIVDEWAAMSQNKASQQAGLQDQVNSLFLKWAMDAQTITNRVANDSATVSARIASNAATVDHIVSVGAITNPAELSEAAIGAKVAAEVKTAAKDAIDAAVAAVPGTSAASQGTSGLAHGNVQMAASIADAAIVAQIAKLAEAVNTLYIKVTGEAVSEEVQGLG